MKRRRIFSLLFMLVFTSAPFASPQALVPASQTGNPANTSADLHGADSVNTQGLGLHIEVPLLSIQERGRTYTWKYVYNTPSWQLIYLPYPLLGNGQAPDPSGSWVVANSWSPYRSPGSDNWKFVGPTDWSVVYDAVDLTTNNGGPINCNLGSETVAGATDWLIVTYNPENNFRLVDPEGTQHQLAMQAFNIITSQYIQGTLTAPYPACPAWTPQLTSPTLDGSGAYYDAVQGGIWLRDGTKYKLNPLNGSYTPPSVIQVEDSNGNILTADMMNRIGLATLSSTPSLAQYQYKDSNGALQTITVNLGSVSVQTNECSLLGTFQKDNPCTEDTGNISLPTSIILPNGSSYQFHYDQGGHAEITSMVLPTGATIGYTYQRIVTGQPNGRNTGTVIFHYGVQTRTETVSSSTNEWAYSISGDTNLGEYVTSVEDPMMNCSLHTYMPVTPGMGIAVGVVETQTIFQSGCGSGATAVKTVGYQYSVTNFALPGLPFGPYNIQPTTVTTTLANGQTSKIQTDYDSFTNGGTYGGPGSWQNPTEVREYDFGAATPTRTTDYTYVYNTGSSTHTAAQYLAQHIISKLTSKTISNASGPVQKTTYDYDNYGSGIASSGVYAGRDLTYGNWGNATSNTVTDSLTGHAYTTSYSYEDTGNLIKVTDPRGGLTNYSYADNWTNTACALASGQGHIYLSRITDAMQETSSYAYDSCSGALSSITDANTQTTTLGYDLLGRTTQISYPDGGLKSYSYLDTPPVQMTASQMISPSTTSSTTTVYDGLGRPTQTQMSDPFGLDYITTTYDGNGRVHAVSNPYRSLTDTTYGVTTFSYDPLGRKTSQIQQDGISTVSWCYDGSATITGQINCSGNKSTLTAATWVDSTDESGNHTQQLSDGLGRLRAVMEPDATSGSLSMETDYTYDTLDNLLGTNQKGEAGDSARTRSFTYDGFSRLICSSNPESSQSLCPTVETAAIPSGVTSYSYDANNNLATKTDARGVVTTYGYDSVNRLVTKMYSGPGSASAAAIASATLPSGFTYGAVGSNAIPNGVGRLISEYTGSSTTPTSKRAVTTYDAMGRVKTETQCATITGCSAAGFSFQYGYDLAGDTNISTNGDSSTGIMFISDYDAAHRLQTVTSSWNDATHPAVLFGTPSTGPQYGPIGLTSATLGISTSGQYSLQRTYDNRLHLLTETDQHTSSDSNTLSSGKITIAGNEQEVAVGVPATAMITITGTEGSKLVCPDKMKSDCYSVPDSGTLTLSIDGFTATANYGSGATDPTVAASLATAASVPGSPVTATSSGNVVTLTSVATGSVADYAFSITNGADFSGTDSSATLTGGGSVTAYDSGSISVTVDGVTVNAPWGGATTNAQSVASIVAAVLQSADSSIVSATAANGVISITSKQAGSSGDSTLTCSVQFNSTLFTSSSFSTSCSGMSGGAGQVSGQYAVYNYSIPAIGGYAPNGNLLSVSDSVMGNWAYSYDHLNRLTAAQASANAQSFAPFGAAHLAWSYDSFGNNKGEVLSGATSISLPQVAHTYTGVSFLNGVLQHIPGNNQMDGYNYDASGNLLSDNVSSTYTYDAEGRVATVGGTTSYLYDAEGRRVAKQAIRGSTVTLSSQYLLGLGGEQVTELNGSGVWLHTNAYAAGKLLATYTATGLHFNFTDWLESKRIQASGVGSIQPEESCQSLPFGDDLGCTGSVSDATEHHFTGKERDTESGLDYMEARYYGSSMGRFMSPDPLGGHPEDPQTLNRYAYARNNPLTFSDPTGLDFNLTCTAAKDGSNASTCQGGLQGTTTTANGKSTFTATIITSASLSDPKSGNTATVNENGVQITTAQGTSGAKFIDHTPAADINGSGKFADFSFRINGSCGGSCLDSGTFKFNGTPDQARDLLDQRGAFRSIVDRAIPGLGKSVDEMKYHPDTTQHRFGDDPSPHFSVPRDPKGTVPTVGPFHVDTNAPGLKHLGCATVGVGCN